MREAAAHRVLAYRNEEIADVLLHQEVLAGVGNVFKSEICFVTGINPFCQVAALTPRTSRSPRLPLAQRLVGANVLEDSGDAIVTYRRPAAPHHACSPIRARACGSMAAAGEPCRRCGEPIRRRIRAPMRA